MSEDHVRRHIEDFNAHDRDALLAGLTPDCRWTTGRDTVTGHAALGELFDDGLWSMDPRLQIRSLVASDDRVAIECVEEITVEGERLSFAIAGFYECADGLISRVKIYREGSAEL